jgi:hypothetical protein
MKDVALPDVVWVFGLKPAPVDTLIGGNVLAVDLYEAVNCRFVYDVSWTYHFRKAQLLNDDRNRVVGVLLL